MTQSHNSTAFELSPSDTDASSLAHELLPTLPERKAAAERVLNLYPHWSDRSIGLITGVSNKTVSKLRECATGEMSRLSSRLGRDGRIRPVSPAGGRRRAAEVVATNPHASLREIARKAGVSVTTARDVRQRLDKGESPLPDNLAKKVGQAVAGSGTDAVAPLRADGRDASQNVTEGRGRDLLQRLRDDPSVRSSERGRTLLRLLSTVVVAISACNEFSDAVPRHCAGAFAEIARKNARAWQEIAEKFEARVD